MKKKSYIFIVDCFEGISCTFFFFIFIKRGIRKYNSFNSQKQFLECNSKENTNNFYQSFYLFFGMKMKNQSMREIHSD